MKITHKILKYAVLGGLFFIPFIPFIVPNAMFFPFITGKGFTFRILVEVLFGLFAILAFMDTAYRPKMSWITKSMLIFTGVILLADLFGANPYKSLWSNYERMEGFVLIAHLVLYYIVVSSMFRTKKEWNRFFDVSIFSSVIMSFYAIMQLAGKAVINQGGVRVDGTFGNATYLAIFLVFNIFFSLYFLIDTAKPKWQRWAYAAAGVLNLVILYFTATRGAILGLIGGLTITGIIVLFREKENKFIRKTAYSLIIALVVVIGGFLLIKNTSFVQKSPVLSRFSSLGISEIKNQGRYFVWPMAAKGILENPILGWGQENFNFVFNKYYDPRMYGQEQWFDRTHDIVLDWLIAGGILGFLSYASMYGFLVYYIWRKKSLLSTAEKGILTGMIAAYIFHNIFVFDNLISYILFFSILGYVHSISTERDEPSAAFYSRKFSDASVAYIATPIIAVLTLGLVYYVNIPALFANTTLIRAMSPQQGSGPEKNLELFKQVYGYNSFGSTEATEQLAQIATQVSGSQVTDTIKQGFYDLAKTKLEEKVRETPHDARYLVFAGSFFNHYGQYDLAITNLENAIKESPKKQTIYFELGTSYLGKKDTAKMFQLFKQAYQLEPSSKESQIIYTLGAIYTKDQAALLEMSKVLDLSLVVTDNRFLKAYADIGDYNNVISILNSRLEKDPTNAQYKVSLASAYATIGQKQKAIDILRQMIVDDPTFKTTGEGYIKQIQSS